MEAIVNNLDLFVILRETLESLTDSEKLYTHLMQKMGQEENSDTLKKFCQCFCANINSRWTKSHRPFPQFLRRNGDWLETPINWPQIMNEENIEHNIDVVIENVEEIPLSIEENIENLPPSTENASTSSFTPRKPFEELSSKQKRRRVVRISESYSPEELNAATIQSLKTSGNEEISLIIKHLTEHPEDIAKVRSCLDSKKGKDTTYSPMQALAILVSLKLSKWQYINLRESASEQGTELYPSYHKIKLAKLECYSAKEDIILTDEGASIKLQALLNLNAIRLLQAVEIDTEKKEDFKLVSKWGFDGAGGQSNYKQRNTDNNDDSSVFMASLVPIRLLRDGVAVWENDRPSSTFYCRPIMFKFMKENQLSVESVKKSIDDEIDALQLTSVKEVNVGHQLLMTMIDGKITSYLSETSTSACDICKAKPSDMNDLDSVERRPKNTNIYQYGLSSLHAWIRCMECLLHIAYHMEIKKWSCRGEDKQKLNKKKKQIQEDFKSECGLLIDIVKQGAGTTNDGNTARRFFSNADTSARITGLDKNFIERFHVVLQAIASGERINIANFSLFCRETANLYVQLYPWYYMPSSVHKFLMHGGDIIEHFGMIPIGQLSEEASEARNKDFRNFRRDHSRKISRLATNEDILHNLLLSSDPVLTSIRPRMAKQTRMPLSPQTIELLMLLPTEPNQMEFIDIDSLQDNFSDSG